MGGNYLLLLRSIGGGEDVMKNPWNQSPQNWNAYGLNWEFTYDELTAKRTITATGFKLDIKVSDTTKFPSPHLWLEAWAKKNKKRLPSQNSEAVTFELNLFPQPELQTEVVPAEVVTEELTETEELTDEEQSDRLFLERKVEQAFWQAGRALKELRSRRLYRSTHKTFEEYCRDRFDYSRRKMDYLIAGSEVFDNLQMRTNCSQNLETETRTNCSQILPTRENQVRPLTKLEPEQQLQAWTKAVESAGGKVPSGRIVKDIVQRIKERVRPPNPYHVGDICRIIASDEPELRGKGGQWCIISEIHEFSCTVKIYQGEITIRLDNLRLIDYSTADCEALAQLRDRLHQLYSQELEETAVALVDLLAKLDRPYLTALEEKLLAVLGAQ